MRNRLGVKVRNFFIGHHLQRAEDSFEEAKVRLIFSFFVAFLMVTLAFFPFFFKYENRTFTYINIAFYSLYILPFFILKYTRSYETASFLFGVAVVLAASANSIFNNGLLTPNISVWYFIAVAFGAYTLRPRYIISLVVIMYICLSIIDWLKYNDYLHLSPNFSEKENLDATPFIMVLTFPLILKLLVEYVRSKQGAISNLKSSVSERDRILGVVAHDLRNPIGAAINCLEMGRRHLAGGNQERLARYLTLADESCRRALAQIEELLELSKLRGDERRLQRQPENTVPFVRQVVDAYRARADQKHLALRFADDMPEVWICVNKLQFSRVLDNVISNAIKFTDEGGTVDVRVDAASETVTISVKDTGIGIPDALREKLFAEYTPSSREGTDHEFSVGLGMAISQKIVTLHSGRIWFESSEGNGSTFYIEIPRCAAPALPE
ncbi:MAG: hypothetical protein JXX29_10940 [Deltaproteobacteria bacterium]|nr:hypothetical protein [Deltaproteobacteria bacterium]MBN2672185.1 hypothetical protein [Deltaproteobacteria bacterium]